jgi:hypothetical protein
VRGFNRVDSFSVMVVATRTGTIRPLPRRTGIADRSPEASAAPVGGPDATRNISISSAESGNRFRCLRVDELRIGPQRELSVASIEG